MESERQTHISQLALIVSILSLVVTIVMAINQYKENIEVVIGRVDITSIDINNSAFECEIHTIVANTSQTTTSLLRAKAYKTSPGLQSPEELEIMTVPDMPITLIQGSAETLVVKCQYPLDEETLKVLTNGDELPNALNDQWISIRIYSAKGKSYSSNANFDRVWQEN